MITTELLADILVLAVAALFLGMGLIAFAQPGTMLDRFGIRVEGAAARAEVRAVYGGFGVVVAGMLAYAALIDDGRGQLWIPSVIALALLGMAAGRLISVVLERTAGSSQTWIFCSVEVVLATALFASHTLR